MQHGSEAASGKMSGNSASIEHKQVYYTLWHTYKTCKTLYSELQSKAVDKHIEAGGDNLLRLQTVGTLCARCSSQSGLRHQLRHGTLITQTAKRGAKYSPSPRRPGQGQLRSASWRRSSI